MTREIGTAWTLRILAASLAFFLAACGADIERNYPGDVVGSERSDPNPKPGSQDGGIFGTDGLLSLGGDGESKSRGSAGIGVNGFLWRASLDTLAFMPLTSADPFGGVIITDWYTTADQPNERFKVTVYILDKTLRADGLRVSVFRQELHETGSWVDAKVAEATPTRLEDAILTRARQLRIANVVEPN
jgi:hypothetical protein